MSEEEEEEEKKKKKKKAIIAGIIGSVALIGGSIGGIIATTSETEEEKKNRKKQSNVDTRKDLNSVIIKKNLGTIETNGNPLTEKMIKDKLENKIDKLQIAITIDAQNNKATIKPTSNSIKYKGEVTVNYTLDTKQKLDSAISNKNLGIIATNGASTPTKQMIKDKLPANIKNEVDIKIQQGNKATLTAKANSNYKGTVEVNFTVDKSVELSTAFTDLNLGTIETNGNPLTEKMIKDKLENKIDKLQIAITIDAQNNKATIKPTSNSIKYKGEVTVNYTLDTKQKLDSAISNKNLGIIATNGASTPTKQMIKDKLPANIKNEVDIKIQQGNKATLTAKANSNYKGTVEVNFTVDKSVELSTAFTDLNLGTIETNGNPLTEKMIKDKLENKIDKLQIAITIDAQNNKATIKPTSNSIKYKGEVTVNYTLDTKQKLDSAISNKNLGIIATNGASTPTKQMIKDKLPANIKNEVDIKIQQGNKATLTAKANSNYKGTVEVNFTVDKSVELSTAFTDLNLGTIETNGNPLTEKMIKDKLENKIDKLQIAITIDAQNNKATIKPTSNSIKYKGEVTVNYTLDTKQKLDSAISNKNLGIIATNGASTPTKQMIKDKLPANIKNEVDIKIQQGNKATLTAKANSNYKGTVEVNFTVDKSVELSTAFTNLNLGTIETNGNPLTEKMIKDKLKKTIKDKSTTNISSINFKKIDNQYARIEYRYKSVYKGEVTVNYTLDTKQTLDSAISNKNLGIIATNGASTPTKQMIKDKLPANIKNEVDIKIQQGNKATLTAKANSNYKGTVEVNFTVDKSVELSTAFTNLNLGTIETNGNPLTEKMIKDKLPANIKNEVDIKIQQGNKATLTAKASSNYKGTVEVNFTVDKSVELSTAFTNLNLGTIETNGNPLTEKMIKDKLKKTIKDKSTTNISSINFKKIDNQYARIEYRYKSVYKGEVTVNYTLDTKQTLDSAISNKNLGIIATNGASTPTKQMIKDKLPANIKNEVDIKIQQGNKATLTAKANSNYKGTVEVTYTLDTRIDLSKITELNGLNITANTTATNNDLWNQILSANEFKNLKKGNGYKTFMYKTNNPSDIISIKNSKQKKGDIYIILQVDKEKGINCFGTTPRFKVTLK